MKCMFNKGKYVTSLLYGGMTLIICGVSRCFDTKYLKITFLLCSFKLQSDQNPRSQDTVLILGKIL